MFCSFFCDEPERSHHNSFEPNTNHNTNHNNDTNETEIEIEIETDTILQQVIPKKITMDKRSSTDPLYLRSQLGSDFSFRVDNDRDLIVDEPNTVHHIVSKEDWHQVSILFFWANDTAFEGCHSGMGPSERDSFRRSLFRRTRSLTPSVLPSFLMVQMQFQFQFQFNMYYHTTILLP